MTCLRWLKVLFVTILETKIVTNNIFNCLRQVAKWGFETNITTWKIKWRIYFLNIVFTNFYSIPFVSMDVICNVKSHIQIWWMEMMKIFCHPWNEIKPWIEEKFIQKALVTCFCASFGNLLNMVPMITHLNMLKEFI